MKTISLFIISLISFSCTSNSKHEKVKTVDSVISQQPVIVKDDFKKGEVISSVNLRNDTSQKFALYLPSTYSEAEKFPVIIFFDPHGEGTVPLNLYFKLAEKYRFILIASNSSKNGLDMQTTNAIAGNLINEVSTRFSVDKTKISLCGFSGGAKVALLTGAENTSISNIIYCGASIDFHPNHPLNILGFAGKRDMNYTDVVSFEWNLKNVPFKHFLIEWNGKHEFPIAGVFNNAFDLLTTGEIKNYAKKQITITPQKVNDEQAIKQKYMEAFKSKDINWWKQEIQTLNSKKKNDLMYERLLGFISLACYSYSNNALQQNNLDAAEYILTIYKLADPENEAMKQFTEDLNRRKNQH